MKRAVILPSLSALIIATASAVSAAPILSGDGETWTSALVAVCAQVGGGSSCSGTTVDINSHPAWMDDSLTVPLASWVSYADTGYGGSALAPRAGDVSNPVGHAVIMEILESFQGVAGGALSVRFWADDTLDIYYNNVLVRAAVFGQDICANAPIGCQPGEYWDLIDVTTGGTDTIRMLAYQVGTGPNPNSNPFGVLYSGTYTEVEQANSVPEPATLALFGVGATVLSLRSLRKRTAGPRPRR